MIHQDTNNLTIFIVNYNTYELTNNAIQSIRKFSNDTIVLFDNSDKEIEFKNSNINNIKIINNTKQNIINFNEDFERLDKKFKIPNHIKQLHKNGSNFGSYKHCKTIQWAFENIKTDNLIIFDSDIILKHDFKNIINQNYITAGQIEIRNNKALRIYPFIQYINLKIVKQHKINFFDETRMQDISQYYNGYDTGGSFYEDICKNNLPIMNINFEDYIEHLGGGSWRENFLRMKHIYK